MFNRRGVSEALGFILVFSIIITMTALVYTTGFADLQDARDFEQGNNAERAFDVLKANLEDIVLRNAPSRGTEVKLADAQLYTGDPVPMFVIVSDDDDYMENTSFTPYIEPITYATDDSAVTYVNGAIFRESVGGEVMIQEPQYVLSDERVVMPLTHTYSESGSQSVSGSRTVLVRSLNAHDDGLPNVMDVPDADTYNVTVLMQSPRAASWQTYFEREGFDCELDDDVLSCEKRGVENVTVTRMRIKVVFE